MDYCRCRLLGLLVRVGDYLVGELPLHNRNASIQGERPGSCGLSVFRTKPIKFIQEYAIEPNLLKVTSLAFIMMNSSTADLGLGPFSTPTL